MWIRPVAIPLGVDDMCRMSSSRIIAHRVRKVGINGFIALIGNGPEVVVGPDT